MPIELTPATLGAATFRGPVRFYDGRGGMARQDFECVAEPRFGYAWQRENSKDHGRQYYMVDGREVQDLEEACRLLALPPDAKSPAEMERQHIDEFKFSPKLNYGATRALSEARCNADVAPFSALRAWQQRAGGPLHSGYNRYADEERKAGREFPHWAYRGKDAFYETFRGMYLFTRDRQQDTGLQCVLDVACRECPILKHVEAAYIDARDNPKWPKEIEDTDIDAAKIWTCVAHVLTAGPAFIDGGFWHTAEDRKHVPNEFGF